MQAKTYYALAALLGFYGATASAQAATLVALTSDGKLTRIDTESRRAAPAVTVSGATGRVLAIDVRPADGQIYGLTEAGSIIRIDAATGAAQQVSTVDKKLETGARTTINFNPTVDRLRVIGINGSNYRINVDTGAVTVDGTLKYAPGTPMAGTLPMVTAASYTNAYSGSKETMLYTLDTVQSQLNLQAPPNDGVQQIKGPTGMSLPPGVGFEILSDGAGGNIGYLVAGGALHTVDLASGKVSMAGPIPGMAQSDIVSLTAMK